MCLSEAATQHTSVVVASFHQKPPVSNSVSLSFSIFLDTFDIRAIGNLGKLRPDLPTSSNSSMLRKWDMFRGRECLLVIESLKMSMPTADGNDRSCAARHARTLCFSCDSGDYGNSEVLEHNHCLRTFTQPLLHLASLSLPPPHRPNSVHIILDCYFELILMLVAVFMVCVYVGVVIPLPNENM